MFALYFSVWKIYEDFTLPFTLSLYPFHLSIPFTSLFLYLSLSYLSLPLYISPSTFLSLSLLISVFSLSFSLAYLMDVFFVLVKSNDHQSWLIKDKIYSFSLKLPPHTTRIYCLFETNQMLKYIFWWYNFLSVIRINPMVSNINKKDNFLQVYVLYFFLQER